MTHRTPDRLLWVALILVAAVTRMSALPQPFPDASLAALFLAGFYLSTLHSFAVSLAALFLVDWVTLSLGAADSACISVGYLFLVPSYYLVWRGGVWARRISAWSRRAFVATAGALMLSTSLAFILSNAGFYWFAPSVRAIDGTDFIAAVAHYFPGYVGAAAFYVLPVLLAERLAGRSTRRNSVTA